MSQSNSRTEGKQSGNKVVPQPSGHQRFYLVLKPLSPKGENMDKCQAFPKVADLPKLLQEVKKITQQHLKHCMTQFLCL